MALYGTISASCIAYIIFTFCLYPPLLAEPLNRLSCTCGHFRPTPDVVSFHFVTSNPYRPPPLDGFYGWRFLHGPQVRARAKAALRRFTTNALSEMKAAAALADGTDGSGGLDMGLMLLRGVDWAAVERVVDLTRKLDAVFPGG